MSENLSWKAENLKAVYHELCTSYRDIADFLAKLLSFLPLASGVGIFFITGTTSGTEFAIVNSRDGWYFRLRSDARLFTYKLRGIQRCNAMIETGKILDEKLVFPEQSRFRPDPVNGIIDTHLCRPDHLSGCACPLVVCGSL